jgi:hypothetical protein
MLETSYYIVCFVYKLQAVRQFSLLAEIFANMAFPHGNVIGSFGLQKNVCVVVIQRAHGKVTGIALLSSQDNEISVTRFFPTAEENAVFAALPTLEAQVVAACRKFCQEKQFDIMFYMGPRELERVLKENFEEVNFFLVTASMENLLANPNVHIASHTKSAPRHLRDGMEEVLTVAAHITLQDDIDGAARGTPLLTPGVIYPTIVLHTSFQYLVACVYIKNKGDMYYDVPFARMDSLLQSIEAFSGRNMSPEQRRALTAAPFFTMLREYINPYEILDAAPAAPAARAAPDAPAAPGAPKAPAAHAAPVAASQAAEDLKMLMAAAHLQVEDTTAGAKGSKKKKSGSGSTNKNKKNGSRKARKEVERSLSGTSVATKDIYARHLAASLMARPAKRTCPAAGKAPRNTRPAPSAALGRAPDADDAQVRLTRRSKATYEVPREVIADVPVQPAVVTPVQPVIIIPAVGEAMEEAMEVSTTPTIERLIVAELMEQQSSDGDDWPNIPNISILESHVVEFSHVEE